MKCPGQNTQFWKPEDIRECTCPACGASMEFWKDDAKRECRLCGFQMHNPGKDLGCALWCKSAKECLGMAGDEWEDLLRRREEATILLERKKNAMKTRTVRKIIRIDEEKCTGCGECIPSCAEGALRIVDGKARLVTDRYCDGLGACLAECPAGALSIEERPADEFDEEAVEEHLRAARPPAAAHPHEYPSVAFAAHECPSLAFAAHACPSAQPRVLPASEEPAAAAGARGPSCLGNWPVQLGLVNPGNPAFRGADVLIVSDCVPVAYRYFHEDLLKGKVPIMGCPKLDEGEAYLARLKELFRNGGVKSVTIARMEVPCCGGMTHLVREALKAAGSDIPVKEVVVTVGGEIRP